MIAMKLRAVATALVLGTAAVATAGALVTTQAEAAVRAVVGKPLQAALAAAASGNYSAAMAHVREAEAAGGLSSEEQATIAKTRQYIEAKSGGSVGVSDAVGAQAKFDADYRAGRYRDAINDEDLLRKYGALNATNVVVIGQAYYRMGDYKGCVRYTSQHSGMGSDILEMQARCAFETHDDNDMRDATEQLVAVSGTPQHWNQLLRLVETAKGLSDHQTVDIYRMKYMTGTMSGADDYFTLAQLLIAAGLPSEARTVVEKGMSVHLLVDARAQRLLALAKQSQANDLANLGKTVAAANAAKNGDALIKLGEDYCGMGRYPDAVAAIVAGIKRGTSDADNAQVRLGQAYYGAGQKPAALSALAKTTTPNGQVVSRMWALYVRGH